MSSEHLIETALHESPLRTVQGVKSRVRGILDALERESWLPMGLRSMAVEGLIGIQSGIDGLEPNLRELSDQVNSIAYALFSYGDKVSDSEVASQIKIFEEELAAINGNS